MRTDLPAAFLETPAGARANDILRSCVHCGFCNATCPTYQALGDELDGPRGRIYLIKGMLETGEPNAVAQRHLDRCLTCRACETTCPSGVRYGELLEIGREFVETGLKRGLISRIVRHWLKAVVSAPARLRRWLWLGRAFRPFAPKPLRSLIAPPDRAAGTTPAPAPNATVILLSGCVQSVMTPAVNDHVAALLAARGVAVRMDAGEGCCGALALHLGDAAGARAAMRANLDSMDWHEATRIISTATGCGVTLKEYGQTLGSEPHAAPAQVFADKVCDVAEALEGFEFEKTRDYQRIAWHAPCSLQHGQRLTGRVERLLAGAGYELVPVRDAHLCCGSAGTYSILQPKLAETLRRDKVAALTEHAPEAIATANIGCQMHLGAGADVPVLHWVQLLK